MYTIPAARSGDAKPQSFADADALPPILLVRPNSVNNEVRPEMGRRHLYKRRKRTTQETNGDQEVPGKSCGGSGFAV